MRETVFRVQPAGRRWELRRDRTLLYWHGDRQIVVDHGRATAEGNRPSRFMVHRPDGSIESETRYELDLAVYLEGPGDAVSLEHPSSLGR